MKQTVVSALPHTPVLDAARLMIRTRVGTLPLVGSGGKLIGVVNLRDILNVFIPNYFDLMENMSFVHDFGALEDFLPKDVSDIAHATLETLQQTPVFVDESESIFRAITKMIRHDPIDLPVVNSRGQLVGLASHVDVGIAFLQKWIESKGFSP
jgi:CBS domain-containing protein